MNIVKIHIKNQIKYNKLPIFIKLLLRPKNLGLLGVGFGCRLLKYI